MLVGMKSVRRRSAQPVAVGQMATCALLARESFSDRTRSQEPHAASLRLHVSPCIGAQFSAPATLAVGKISAGCVSRVSDVTLTSERLDDQEAVTKTGVEADDEVAICHISNSAAKT